jgi:hypothetical protein
MEQEVLIIQNLSDTLFIFALLTLVDYIEAMFMCFLGRGKKIASDDRVHQILMFKNNGKNVLNSQHTISITYQ